LGKDIKMMAVGMADNEKKIKVYKKKLKVKFPLIPDENLEVYFKLGRTGTPYMILANKDGKVLWTHAGGVESIEETLKEIREFHKNL